MKGIVLAGGTGSRLWPITKSVSKQLLPIYDKPMIYYPISTLMLAGIRDILIITTPSDQVAFQNLLGDGSQYGVSFSYLIQPKPEGIAQAFIIAEKFIAKDSVALILGDNIFYGVGLGASLNSNKLKQGAHIFTSEVSNPSDYGIISFDDLGKPTTIEEKPKNPSSNFAVTGLYFFGNEVVEIAKKIAPSARMEYEITSVIEVYISKSDLEVTRLSRGVAWLDTGNFRSLHDAGTFIRILEERQGLRIGDLTEIAQKNNWISNE